MSDSTPLDENPLRTGAPLSGRLTMVGGLAAMLAVLMLAASLIGAYPLTLPEMLAAVAAG